MDFKKNFCLTMLILTLFTYGCSKPLEKNPAYNESQSINNNVKEHPKEIDTSNSELKKEKPKEIYDILGSSNKLTPSEKTSLEKWRMTIPTLVKENPSSLFINGYVENKWVALTFDDGPDGLFTPKIIDILKQHNIMASFFFIGKSIDAFPSVVKKAFNENNLILNHSLDHTDLSKKDFNGIKKEVEETENKIYSLIKKKPAIIRPPYGVVDKNTLYNLEQLGYKSVLWSIDTLDWSQKEKDNIVNNVVNNIRSGDIILMHSNSDRQATVDALPIIIYSLKAKGFDFVTLDKLLGVQAYK
ncbi:polysaccharide deacetylase family protein [Desnuesiella massiliensis]|uniref:polysaccharide deacetylase family protein n=1 Tax=Desnuesiella massiliensis TaxID=1650662 RepID=UPI0006E3E478|nr:polysaccharide deacetylase family protein [Desnuesiella massiliensis]